jgi:hypothetical protein
MRSTESMSDDYPPITLPIVAVLPHRFEWAVKTKETGQDQVFSFTAAPVGNGAAVRSMFCNFKATNAKTVCSDFLAVSSIGEAERFFQQYGPLEVQLAESAPESFELFDRSSMIVTEIRLERRSPATKSRTPPEAMRIRWSELLRYKSLVEAALIRKEISNEISRSFWLAPLPLRLQIPPLGLTSKFVVEVLAKGKLKGWKLRRRDDLLPTAFVSCPDALSAIRANVMLSEVTQGHWKRCLRRSCGRAFEQDSKYPTKYCSRKCASAESSRASYEAKKLAKAEGETHQ